MSDERATHLAWHETLELHEMVAMQSTAIIKCKLFIEGIQDQTLKSLYIQVITDLEHNVTELLNFYSKAPREEKAGKMKAAEDGFYAGELLSFIKAQIKGLAGAVTETATPALKEVFIKQLNHAIKSHTKIFNYMHKKGYYPAYDLEALLESDQKNAKKALEM
ncbi:spore coat protein [Camelliibacillus cellulosilyticus]|uniref:Spore coat protein n=1 Tax=Camelliibacillus cellulosilyticus TaxID=2174486 RepID=A0ABV9GR00_9BACL